MAVEDEILGFDCDIDWICNEVLIVNQIQTTWQCVY